MGRPRCVAEASRPVLGGEFQQAAQAPDRLVDAAGRIADLLEPFRDGVHREGLGFTACDFVPRQGRRDPGIGGGANGVGGRDRAVLRILVVVEEDPLPFFLPPAAGGDVGGTPPDLASQGGRGPAGFPKWPAWVRPGGGVGTPPT